MLRKVTRDGVVLGTSELRWKLLARDDHLLRVQHVDLRRLATLRRHHSVRPDRSRVPVDQAWVRVLNAAGWITPPPVRFVV